MLAIWIINIKNTSNNNNNKKTNDTIFFFEQFDKYIYFTCFKKKDLFLGGRQRKQLNFILRASQKIDIPVSSLAVL